jgi:cytochrome c peroxidase
VRVHDLPDFVYFDHSIHVNKGIGCQSCHGQVDNMPLMLEQNSLQMEWCLDCHRNPAKFIRPRTTQAGAVEKNGKVIDEGVTRDDTIFDMKYQQPGHDVTVYAKLSDGVVHAFHDQMDMGKKLMQEYHVRSVQEITSCNTCHR